MNQVNPHSSACDSGGLRRAADLLRNGSDRGLYPGGVLWVSKGGRTELLCSVGRTGFSGGSRVDERTLYDIASLTKPVATATALLLLCQDGLIRLDQRVGEFFPDRDTAHLGDVTLRRLITHTSGLPAYCDLYSGCGNRAEAIDRLFAVRLVEEPDRKYVYSCIGYMLLGLVVEAVSGLDLDRFTCERVFKPLGMCDTGFNPEPGDGRAIASAGPCPHRGKTLVGEVHDPNAWAFDGIAGNSGLFSTVQDLAKFCHSVTLGQKIVGEPLFDKATRDIMFTNALPIEIGGHALGGWFTWPNTMLPVEELVTQSTVGHSGFTGTAIILDPKYEMCCVLLTNRVCREGNGDDFRALRRKMCDAVLGAIVW